MLHIAKQFIWYRKKNSCLLILVAGLCLALMLAIGPMFENAQDQIFHAYADRYGRHHGAVFYLNAEKRAVLQAEEAKNRLEYGLFSNGGQWTLQATQQKITLGWFSEEAKELGRLQLLEGRFAQADDEIVLERNVIQYKCPVGTKLGDTLLFAQGDCVREFTLVGVLRDYVGNWTSFSDDSLIEGQNDFPRGLVASPAVLQPVNDGALLYFERYDMVRDADRMTDLAKQWGDAGTAGTVLNTQLYFYVENTIMRPFASFRLLMMAVVMAGGMVIMSLTLSLYVERFRESYAKLYVLGGSDAFTARIYAWQAAGTMLLSLLFGVVGAQVLSWIVGGISGWKLSIFTTRKFFWPAMALLVLGIFLCLSYVRRIKPLARQALSQQKKRARRREMQVGQSLTIAICRDFIRQNFRKVELVLLVIVFLVSAMGIAEVYSGQFEVTSDYEYAFTMSASTGYAGFQVYPFELTNWKENLFPVRQVAELEALPGVHRVFKTAITNASMVIPVEGSPYWGRFVAADKLALYGGVGYYATAVAGAPTSGVTVLTSTFSNYNVVVLSAENLAAYQEAYPNLPVEKMRQEGSVALVLPPVVLEQKDEMTMEDILAGHLPEARKEIHYDTLQVGGQLRFGRMEYDKDTLFSELTTRPDLLRYREMDYTIGYITETVAGTGEQTYGLPTVLILEETNAGNPLVEGYFGLNIQEDGDISETDYAALEAKVTQIALSNPGSVVHSAREEREQNQELMRIVNLSLGMILGVFGVFTVIAIYSALYMTILRRKRSLAIYRALGLPRWKFAMAMLIELLFYWLLAILLAFVVSMIAFHAIWHITSLPYMGMPMMRVLVLALLAGLPLNGFIVWSLQRNIYSESVYAAMRLGE